MTLDWLGGKRVWARKRKAATAHHTSPKPSEELWPEQTQASLPRWLQAPQSLSLALFTLLPNIPPNKQKGENRSATVKSHPLWMSHHPSSPGQARANDRAPRRTELKWNCHLTEHGAENNQPPPRIYTHLRGRDHLPILLRAEASRTAPCPQPRPLAVSASQSRPDLTSCLLLSWAHQVFKPTSAL